MVASFILKTVLLFCEIVFEEACRWGSGTDHYYHTTVWNSYSRNKHKHREPREHWDVPDNLKGDYGKWIGEYLTNRSIIEKNKGAGSDDGVSIGPDGKIRGITIPTAWQGYGVGNGGDDPPPWAIVPYAYGKPALCFMEPDKGHCAEKVARWGYNSYHATCHQFVYSGCGGNQNNFRTRKRCEESCVHDIQSNCQKYGEYIEY